MKKLFILPVLLFVTVTGFAQLKVRNNGDTFIPRVKSLRFSSSGAGNRLRLVHNGSNDAIIEYYKKLWFNSGSSSARGDRRHVMVMTHDGKVGIGTNYPGSALDVRGTIKTTKLINSSDERLKEGIRPMKGDLAKLKKLKPVSYQFKFTHPMDTSATAAEEGAINGRRHKREHMGFLAQDFQEVFPDLVHEDENGLLGIDYVSLIPCLVEALQEQQKQIDKLKRKIRRKNKNARATDDYDTKGNGLEGGELETVLYQNRPNPFSESTEIDIELAEDADEAFLYVYDMQGVQKKKYSVTGKGRTSVVIQGGELTAGMYIYALVTGGEVIDTKKMILTD